MLGSQPIVGVVGQLQLEVLASRIAAEYKIEARFQTVSFDSVRWIGGDDAVQVKDFTRRHLEVMAEDRDGSPVFFARNVWELNRVVKDWPDLKFSTTRERA
jgi:peptide chain release factor 3